MTYMKVNSQNVPGGTERRLEKSVGISCSLVDILAWLTSLINVWSVLHMAYPAQLNMFTHKELRLNSDHIFRGCNVGQE
jgi:hypothetical protein